MCLHTCLVLYLCASPTKIAAVRNQHPYVIMKWLGLSHVLQPKYIFFTDIPVVVPRVVIWLYDSAVL